MTEVLKLSDLDYQKVSFKTPIKQGNYYYSAIAYNSDQPLYVETPNIFSDEMLTECDNTLRVKIPVDDFSVYDILLNLDENIVRRTTECSESWFKKKLPEEIVRNMYKRITEPLIKDELAKIELRIPKVKEQIQCGVFNIDGIPLAKQEIKCDTEVKCILHIKGLKFLKKYFYCDMYITQIRLGTPKLYNIPSECMFKDDEIDARLSHPDDILDDEMIRSLKDTELKQIQLSKKREEIKLVKDEIKSMNEKLQGLLGEYDILDDKF